VSASHTHTLSSWKIATMTAPSSENVACGPVRGGGGGGPGPIWGGRQVGAGPRRAGGRARTWATPRAAAFSVFRRTMCAASHRTMPSPEHVSSSSAAGLVER